MKLDIGLCLAIVGLIAIGILLIITKTDNGMITGVIGSLSGLGGVKLGMTRQ